MDTFFLMPVSELLFVRAAHNRATELTKASQISKWRFLKQIIFLLRARVYLRQEIHEQEPATAQQQRIMCDLLKNIFIYILYEYCNVKDLWKRDYSWSWNMLI